MPALHYQADLRSVSPDERERIRSTLDTWSIIGTQFTDVPFVFTFFLEDTDPISGIPGIPLELIRQIP